MRRQILPTLTLLLVPALSSASVPAARPPELKLASGAFRPLDGPPTPPGWYRSEARETSAHGRRYLVAMTTGPLTPGQRAQLEEAGAALLDYLPVHGYRLRAAPQAEEEIRSLPFVTWLGELPPHLKIHPELLARAGRAPGSEKIRVILSADEPESRVLKILAGLSPAAAPSGKGSAWRVEAMVPAGRLPAILSRLSGLPEVEAIETARPFRPMNQDAVWVHQSFVGPSPQQTPVFDRGIFGCGQTMALADTGQDYGACYFADPNAGAPPISTCLAAPCPAGTPAPARRKDIIYYNWSGTPAGDDDTCPPTLGASGHGTHTSGSAAGDRSPYADCGGFTSPSRDGGDGQAPGAKLVIQEMGDGLEYLNNRGGTLWNLAEVAYQSGARIHSDSWGGACYDIFGSCIPGCTMPYDSFARDADLAMWTFPDLLMVLSAGNAGQFCPAPLAVGTPGIAKNPVTVGSLGHGAGASTPSDFTSPGPVHDGRLKPTLAAQGKSVVSAASDANPATANCATCSLDGTSMAAPTTAGLAALVREYYAAGFYATGTRNQASGYVPTGALLKATLIDGAVALGASAPGPDFDAGYGRILLDSTLAFTASAFKLRVDDHREGITTGSVVTHAYDVAPGTPLRATLVWTDYPAALNAAVARVNELKLEAVDPNGTVWFQTLDSASGAPTQTANAADPHDTLNVEERLVFDDPMPGRWIIRVSGLDVPWGPQPFALVVRGDVTDCAPPSAPGPVTLSTPGPNEVLVSWDPVPGAAAYNVYRSLGSCPGSPWVPAATGVTGTSYLDTTVSGSIPYSYYAVAASDSAAACESARSACRSIVPTGDCFLQPSFRGLSSAATAGSATCAVNLAWDAASPYCGSDVRYNIYRSTVSGFAPGPANRIARCVTGTSYSDSVDLTYTMSYHYIVRAEDATSGHGGPCRGGNEEGNLEVAGAAPAGSAALGTWTDDAGDSGTAAFTADPPWTVATTGGDAGQKVYTAASAEGVCSDLTSPVLTLASPALGPQLFFTTKHDLEYDTNGFLEGSLGQVEIATGPGFTNWTRVPLTPDYPALVYFPFNDCASTQDSDNYFSGTDLTYTTYTASLANWGGGEIRIRFHLSGDYFDPDGNWWIDDIRVTKALIPGSCATAPAGPPALPDGSSVLGQPLDVARGGSDLILTWDPMQCPATAVNLYWGHLGSYGAFAGGVCDLPPTGSASVSLPDNVWFVLAATDGASTDGSWSRDALGAELTYSGAHAACPAITGHATNNGCP